MRTLATLLCTLAACSGPVEGTTGTRATDCASCHPAQYEEWSTSRHAASHASPVFEAMLPHVEEAWGAAARDACVDCHSPGHGGDQAIGCVSCHAAIGNTAEHSGRLVVDLDQPPAGPFGDAHGPHPSRPGGFLASPSLCGTCHEVLGPGLFVEPTLTEYRGSGLAAIGTGCIDCHMPRVDDAPIAVGATRPRARRSHAISGFDPAHLADALALWIEPRDDAVLVVLENAGAGHHVPTGVSFLRDLWVDVTVEDASGTSTTHARVLELGSRPTRAGAPVPLPTDADAIEHRTLAPGEHLTARIPTDSPTRVTATLRARPIRSDTLTALDLPPLPAHTVTTVQHPH